MTTKIIFLSKRKSPFTIKTIQNAVSIESGLRQKSDWAEYDWNAFKNGNKWDLGFNKLTNAQIIEMMNKEWIGVMKLSSKYPKFNRKFLRITYR